MRLIFKSLTVVTCVAMLLCCASQEQTAQKSKTKASKQSSASTAFKTRRYNASKLIKNQYQAERSLYKQAKYSFSSPSVYRQISHYPLASYLNYNNLENAAFLTENQVVPFLQQEANTLIGQNIRERWLRQLYSQGRTIDYIRFYNPENASSEASCNYYLSLMMTGKTSQALSEFKNTWLTSDSLSSNCDQVIEPWRYSKFASNNLIWQRIHLALQDGKTSIARHISNYLPHNEALYAGQYISAYEFPGSLYNYVSTLGNHPQAAPMMAVLIAKTAQTQPSTAASAMSQLRQLRFTQEQMDRIVRGFNKGADVELRSLLQSRNWSSLAALIRSMPSQTQQKPKWLYWLGRSYEQLGQRSEAQKLFKQAANFRDYYGYLAADKVGARYQLAHQNSPVSQQQVTTMAEHPGIQRAIELYRLGDDKQALKEWRHTSKNFTRQDWLAAAKVAQLSGWHQRAIFTIAKAKFWDDTQLRFPVLHENLVNQAAQYNGINSNWIYGIIRQESAFGYSAQSHVGAQGLMQLMPATARATARKSGLPYDSYRIHEPRYNIQLGSSYLTQMYQRFGYNRILASAAYNAGPGRAKRWLNETYGATPADIWVENIPYKETRQYVKNVLMYNVVYALRRGQKATMLEQQEQQIGGSFY